MTLLSGTKDIVRFDSKHKYFTRGSFDFVALAEMHITWKTRLGYHVHENIREPLELSLVGQGGVCQLENWLNEMALGQFCETAMYNRLNESHRQFHRFGAIIIEKLKAYDYAGAAMIFEHEYSQSLRHIIQSLTEINRNLKD